MPDEALQVDSVYDEHLYTNHDQVLDKTCTAADWSTERDVTFCTI